MPLQQNLYALFIHKSLRKQGKFTEHEYHKHRPIKVLFSEYVYFVQICPVFAGPVTYVTGFTKTIPIGTRNEIQLIAEY